MAGANYNKSRYYTKRYDPHDEIRRLTEQVLSLKAELSKREQAFKHWYAMAWMVLEMFSGKKTDEEQAMLMDELDYSVDEWIKKTGFGK